jgi:hypothetical protein
MKTINDLKAALLAEYWVIEESKNLQETHIEVSADSGMIYGSMICCNGFGSTFECGVYTDMDKKGFEHLFEPGKTFLIEL